MQGIPASLCEEIAALARKYLDDPVRDGLVEIESQIQRAATDSRWEDVGKWHRVRLRYLRFKQHRWQARAAERPLPAESKA